MARKENEFIVFTHNEDGTPTIIQMFTPETKKALTERIKRGFEPQCHGDTTVKTRKEFDRACLETYMKTGDI